MIETLFTVNGQDMAPITTVFTLNREHKFQDVVTTMDGAELGIGETIRPVISFRLLPHGEAESEDYRALLNRPLYVTYLDDFEGPITEEFRLDSSLPSTYLLRSVDGVNRYAGEEIRLRAVNVREVF